MLKETAPQSRWLDSAIATLAIVAAEGFLVWLALMSGAQELLAQAETVRAFLEELGSSHHIVIATVVLFSLLHLMAPLRIVVVAYLLMHGGRSGVALMVLALVGALASTYALGRLIATSRFGVWLHQTRAFRRLPLKRVSNSILAVMAIRLLPLGPFALANMVLGAIPIAFVPFMIGSFLSIAPGTAVATAFALGLEPLLTGSVLALRILAATWSCCLILAGVLAAVRYRGVLAVGKQRTTNTP